MSYRIAGIDVHKKMLAVVVSDVEVDSEYSSSIFWRSWVTVTSFFCGPTYFFLQSLINCCSSSTR
jgi:hypothetical protein